MNQNILFWWGGILLSVLCRQIPNQPEHKGYHFGRVISSNVETSIHRVSFHNNPSAAFFSPTYPAFSPRFQPLFSPSVTH